jgi:hypothetical protein
MQRRVGLRLRTDFRVVARDGSLASHCRGIELSAGGIVLDRGRPVTTRDDRIFLRLELRLPERVRPIKALVRPVWSAGHQQGLKFLRVSDPDRLSLAEHLDLVSLRGAPH